jgi:hypothetical protein
MHSLACSLPSRYQRHHSAVPLQLCVSCFTPSFLNPRPPSILVKLRLSPAVSAVVQGRTNILQEARLASPYPKCAAKIPSAATRMPWACSCRTGRLRQPCRIAHSRTLRCKPTTCQIQEPAGLDRPPNASIDWCTRRRASSWRSFSSGWPRASNASSFSSRLWLDDLAGLLGLRFYALQLREADMITSNPSRSSPRAPTGAS